MDDPRANMQDNRLIALGAPRADWTKTPGRSLGFWITLAGFVLALVLPFWGVIAVLVGLAYSMRALRVMPAGVHGRDLVLIALGVAAVTVVVVVARGILGA
ncbi:hypothetical protein [Cryobacterium sp. MDB2-33-2]|uniref:hypothetical protein n=1 Tax=Cryobacterium sp. MDB2-33-2 TaxID=1259179 RepID=UPI001069FA98|nr:hypothetical protein [Cryobacterium sp. MDB2-33-2]TFC11511.1 hypothetical protein E3O59_00670 [Cryobacterium sp. MDB2-33-2]